MSGREAGVAFSPHFKSQSIRKSNGKKRASKKKPARDDQRGREETSEEYDGDPVGEVDEELWAKFQIPIPGKDNAIIVLPRDIDVDDWNMVNAMLNAYVQRLTKE